MRIAVYDHKMDAVTIFELRRAPGVRHDEILRVRINAPSHRPAPVFAMSDIPMEEMGVDQYSLTFRFVRIVVENPERRWLDWWTITAADEETSILLRAIYLDELWVRPGRKPERMEKHIRRGLQMDLITVLGREVGA